MQFSRRSLLLAAPALLLRPANAWTHGSSSAYEGLVASRVRMIQNAPDTSHFYLMTRSAHIASESLSSIKIAFGNFYNRGAAGSGPQLDTGAGSAATITASIEYPAGTFTQVTFSASSSGSISDASVLFSDYMSVSIPQSATFWVRSFFHNPSGVFYNTWQNTFLGEATDISATAISDQTMGGTITNSGSFSYPPVAILGKTINPSVIIVGDSIGAGLNDTEDSSNSATGFNAKIGLVARSLSAPFLNLSVSSEEATTFMTNATARKLLIQKGSHMVTQLGVNDIYVVGTSAATLESLLQSIWALRWSGQKTYQTTIMPETSSTDNWVTLVNQTTRANDSARVTFNTAVRGQGVSGLTGFYDTASVLESSLNSGKWLVTPSPPYTVDGIHPNPTGYGLVPSAGVISPVTYP